MQGSNVLDAMAAAAEQLASLTLSGVGVATPGKPVIGHWIDTSSASSADDNVTQFDPFSITEISVADPSSTPESAPVDDPSAVVESAVIRAPLLNETFLYTHQRILSILHNTAAWCLPVWDTSATLQRILHNSIHGYFLSAVSSRSLAQNAPQEVPSQPISPVEEAVDVQAQGAAGSRRFSPQARSILEQAFMIKPRMNKAERVYIARRTALSVRQVSVWFSNKRARKWLSGQSTQSPPNATPPQSSTSPPVPHPEGASPFLSWMVPEETYAQGLDVQGSEVTGTDVDWLNDIDVQNWVMENSLPDTNGEPVSPVPDESQTAYWNERSTQFVCLADLQLRNLK